jgi:uncharacterized membrane protein YedE/YeeE
MGNFAPVSALAGGLLIGTAAALLLWLNGRIAGVSNITNGLLAWKRGDILWRLLFLGGLVAGAGLYYGMFGDVPVARPNFPGWLLAAGGLLVGLGTSFGSGCTSGHGVCGLGRLSLRSLAATVIFLVTGILTTFVVRHLFGVY